ncbi:MAG: hypothetical protein Q8P82_01545 [bacterium]|nr:hypothetical protein [bacterium]
MPERRMQEGIPIPEEKRSTLFPVAEDNELLFVPEELKDEAARQGLSDVILKKMAVVEFLRVTGAPESEVTANPDFSVAESAYLELLHTRREAQARVSELAASEKMAADTGIAALGTLFESEGTDLSREIAQAKAALQEAERSFVELRDRIREVYTLRKELKASEDRGWSSEKTFQFFIAKQELYSLARRGDALRKYPAYAREEKAVRELEERTDIFGDLVRVRQKAEDLLGEDTESKQKNREEAAAEMIAAHLTPEVERIIDRLVDASIAH